MKTHFQSIVAPTPSKSRNGEQVTPVLDSMSVPVSRPRPLAQRSRHGRRRTERAIRPTLGDPGAPLEPRVLLSLTVQVRYDFDTNGYFDTAQKRALLEQTVNQAVSALDDHLAAIVPSAAQTWQAGLSRPDTWQPTTLTDLVVPADTLILFVGSSDLGGAAGKTSPGQVLTSGLQGTSQAWQDLVQGRGKPGATGPAPTTNAPWGGAISFASPGPYGPASISLTLHELAHVLGLGASPEWRRYVTPAGFTGPNAEAVNGGQPIPLAADSDHFAMGFPSDGVGAALESGWWPITAPYHLTSLDYAALEDIGWSVSRDRFQFASVAATVSPGGDASVTVVRTGGTSTPATVQYTLAPYGSVVLDTQATQTSGMIQFAPGMTTATITIHLQFDKNTTVYLPGYSGPGFIPIRLEHPDGGPVVGPLSQARLVVPPYLLYQQRLFHGRGRRRLLVGAVLFFSSQVDAAQAQDVRHYLVTQPGDHKRSRPKLIAVRSVQYDANANSVTITLGKLNAKKSVELAVTGLIAADGTPVGTIVTEL
jgi:hypothetical protein